MGIVNRDFRRFRMWGVVEIMVKGEDGDEEGESAASTLTPEQLAAVEPALRDLFRYTDLEHPLTKLLYEDRMRRMAREQESIDANA